MSGLRRQKTVEFAFQNFDARPASPGAGGFPLRPQRADAGEISVGSRSRSLDKSGLG